MEKLIFSLKDFTDFSKITSMDADIESFKNACRNGDLETVDKLFDVLNGNVNMLLMRNVGTINGHLNILQFLDKKGVNINERHYYDDKNPLMIAAREGWIDILDYLLLQPEIDINVRDHMGRTALINAVNYGKTDVVDRLLQNKDCQINISDCTGNTAIFYATEKGYLEIVDRLIINGSNIWHITDIGRTLLHVAVQSDNPKILERLLSLGLDVNRQDNQGYIPLMYAVILNNEGAVKILLEYGAGITIKNKWSKKAVDYAKNDNIRALLIEETP